MMAHHTSIRSFAGKAVRGALALGLLAMAVACASAPPPPPVAAPPPPQPVVTSEPTIIPYRPEPEIPRDLGLTPPHMEGREIVRAALLLPFSHANDAVRREADSMLNAAELALFERGGDTLLMIPKDTGGTRAGAEAAARAALTEGADVILGPLFAQAVTGASAAARPRGVPVLAFSTDATVAGQGVYLLSFAPEPEALRASRFARANGATGLAVLAADTPFGRRVAEVLRQEGLRGGLPVTETRFYAPGNVTEATLAIEGLALARDAGAFDAIYVSDDPAALRELSTVLRANLLSARDILMLGPNSWRDDPAAATVGVIDGAYIAAPDESEHAAFAAAYRAAFGAEPTALASLAYDAVALAAQLRGGPEDWDMLENRNGYMGAAGLFRLPPDGVAERGLAVYQFTPAGSLIVDPAPARFDADLAF